ncbi:MAG: F0F1 ATP synthase subunit A [Alphaproteobacteria bacterium]|nr:F0F1 ATP synthase subunit A [Alphaproteobacteria bacterium]
MAAGHAHNPMTQFELKTLAEFSFAGYDFSFTNSTLFMLIAVTLSAGIVIAGMRPAAMVPGRFQMLVEYLHNSIANMVEQSAGPRSKAFFPFIFALFMFIMFCNMLGLVPGGFTVTSHIVINFALALFIFFLCTVVGFVKHGFHFFALFLPKDAPVVMVPVLFVVEIISYCVRPFSLSVRLFANMLAGGILLKIFAGLVGTMILAGGVVGLVLSPLPFILTVGLTGFKLFVAGLQAYIFSILTAVYLHDAIEMH